MTAARQSSLFVEPTRERAQGEPRFAPGEGQGAYAAEVVGALWARSNTIRTDSPAGVRTSQLCSTRPRASLVTALRYPDRSGPSSVFLDKRE